MNAVTAEALAEDLPLDRLEAELMGALRQEHEADEPPVRRARMSNLVIFCDGAEQVELIGKTIPGIVADHPARVLLAIQEPGDGDTRVRGAVNVWCQADQAAPQHICSEQITLRTTASGLEHLPFAVRRLLVGDLPTNLWWASSTPPPLAGPFLQELSEEIQQIIYDSNGWPDPPRGVAACAGWIAGIESLPYEEVGWRVVADLNWRRLKYWRRLLAQALDPSSLPGALDTITELLVEHGPHAVVQAWEIVSWLASRLDWQVVQGHVKPGVEFTWQVHAPHGPLTIRIDRRADGPSEIRRLRMACRVEGRPVQLQFQSEPSALTFSVQGSDLAPRKISTPPQGLDDLLVRQLSDRERDPIFRESMDIAQVFARSVTSGR